MSIFQRGFKSRAEELSFHFRKALGLSKSCRLCAFELADHLDVLVRSPEELGMSQVEAQALMSSSESTWSALCTLTKDDKRIVVHNILHSKARQQSNLMHELAHIILEHELPEVLQNLPWYMRSYDKVHESEAEYLGAALQIPRNGLLTKLRAGYSEEMLAEHFGASDEMVRYRINITGVRRQLRFSGSRRP